MTADRAVLREQIEAAVQSSRTHTVWRCGSLGVEHRPGTPSAVITDAVMPLVSDALAAVEERATILMKDAADRIGREHSSYGCIGCNLCTICSVLEGYDERDGWIAEAQDRIDARLAAVEAERDAARAVIDDVEGHRLVARGAEVDMLGTRPDMDAMEEIALAHRLIDERIAAYRKEHPDA